MKSIYEQADRVIVWLGPTAEESDLAIKTMRMFGRVTLLNLTDRKNLVPQYFAALERQLGDREYDAIRKLFHREYWQRCWIIQEVTTPSSKLSMALCGLEKFPLEYVQFTAIRVLEIDPKRISQGHRPIKNTRIMNLTILEQDRKNENQKCNLDLLFLATWHRFTAAADPRDRVYALLPIADPDLGIQPDYRKSVKDVFTDFVTRAIKYRHRLDVFGIAGLSRTTPGPSWTPDLTRPESDCPFRLCLGGPDSKGTYKKTYDASKSFPETSLSFTQGENSILVEGFIFDSIAVVGGCLHLETVAKELPLWMAFAMQATEGYPAREKVTDVLEHVVMCADMIEDNGNRIERGYKVDLFSGDDLHQTVFRENEYVRNALQLRSLIATSMGYLAIGPKETVPGDNIYILAGGSTPYVLRREAGHWLLVGECYVHGIMDGKAVEDFVSGGREAQRFEIR